MNRRREQVKKETRELRWRTARALVLPVDPHDLDVVRAKRLSRKEGSR